MCTGLCGIGGAHVRACSCGAVLREGPRQRRARSSLRGPSGLREPVLLNLTQWGLGAGHGLSRESPLKPAGQRHWVDRRPSRPTRVPVSMGPKEAINQERGPGMSPPQRPPSGMKDGFPVTTQAWNGSEPPRLGEDQVTT